MVECVYGKGIVLKFSMKRRKLFIKCQVEHIRSIFREKKIVRTSNIGREQSSFYLNNVNWHEADRDRRNLRDKGYLGKKSIIFWNWYKLEGDFS